MRSAILTDTSTQASLHQYDYDYDPAGNRKAEQIDGVVTSSTPNNLNQLTNQSSDGKMHFRGTVNEPATVTVGGNAASVDAAGNFDGLANVNVGTNNVPVVATDVNGNSRTNNYQVTVPSGTTATLLYDLNGNLTNDGSKSYEWDAANRCIAINYGTHRTELNYDGQNRESKRVEKENGAVISTRQFVWCGLKRCEQRDASNTVTKRFCSQGEQIDGNAYFYSRDHLASIRELSDSTGSVHARYDYDPYGVRTKLSGDVDADFGFTDHYVRDQYSDLAFAPLRIYSANLNRWISRDPIEEKGGVNLYGYVGNDPINGFDPLGLVDCNNLASAIARSKDRIRGAIQSMSDADGLFTAANNSAATSIGISFTSGGFAVGGVIKSLIQNAVRVAPALLSTSRGMLPTAVVTSSGRLAGIGTSGFSDALATSASARNAGALLIGAKEAGAALGENAASNLSTTAQRVLDPFGRLSDVQREAGLDMSAGTYETVAFLQQQLRGLIGTYKGECCE